MFRVTLICDGLPTAVGEEAARDIAKGFAEHRTWHKNVRCEWDGTRLTLRAENDVDDDGKATLDEFGDCILAYIVEPGDFRLAVESVSEF